jgi:predicted transcriptional regulator
VGRRVLKISASEAYGYLRALASENRLAILELLSDKILNVQQIADELNVAQPTITSHIQQLEEAGLIMTNFGPGQRGTQKACSSLYDEITIVLTPEQNELDAPVFELSMPLGAYTDHQVSPTCGLAHAGSIIGLLDDPDTFHYPERMKAQILWFAQGQIEYAFPVSLLPKTVVTRLDLSAEMCSEVAGWDNHWASDITMWIGGVEIGTWTSPGDFGDERGRLNPPWWQDRYSQFGLLKNWTVDRRGSYIDGVKISSVTIDQLNLEQGPIRVRLGNKPDARHRGGLTLFGEGFGNYQQDIVLRLSYDYLSEAAFLDEGKEVTPAAPSPPRS